MMRQLPATLKVFILLLLFITSVITGCGHGSPAVPDEFADDSLNPGAASLDPNATANRYLWGLWDIGIEIETGSVEIVPVRDAAFHLNALAFLEPPALSGMTIDTGTLEYNIAENYIAVDVLLTHPFPGSSQYSGFDVRGIVMLPGTYFPFADYSIIVPGEGQPRLLNADGWTRWWNPKEFPGSGIFGYQEGLIGEPGGAGVFTSTLNAYKYFADGLDADDVVFELPADKRGSFIAGSTNRRNYQISFGKNPSDWLRFQYAVDASWFQPYTLDNPSVPDDFPDNANAHEGYAISVHEVENTLWWLGGIGMGGSLNLEMDIYTWRPDEIDRVIIDIPGVIGVPVEALVVPGSGGGPDDPVYSTYTVDIVPDSLTRDGIHDCLIAVETSAQYMQSGTTVFFGPVESRVSGYELIKIDVSWVPPLEWQLVTAKLLSTQPVATISEISVVGREGNKGVYFFGEDYKLLRYDLGYAFPAQHVTTLAGFFSYTEENLYGNPEDLGRFDICPFGQFVASTITSAPSPTFLAGLKRDYAFFFNDYYNVNAQLPVQVGIPNPEEGYFRMVDVAANWASNPEDAKIYWIQTDDPDETTPPNPEITVIFGVYQHEFTGNPYTGDIAYISASLVPAGDGLGLVDIDSVDRLAVDGDPQGVTGSTDLIVWLMETDPYYLECFSVVSSDDSGVLNQYLTTIGSFYATPRDIEVMPTNKGGYSSFNWVVVLEEGTGLWSLECFDQTGEAFIGLYDILGYPYCLDIDPVGYRAHIWFTVEVGGPMYAAVYELGLG